ncbi:MAG: alpha-1,4-glucan--maltose-1-phosphate maltosyltransferase [Verrucomicrobia bacterium]|nr:alpha-1,4-glucan--maltose-1-phosphate maltosyltransferase [Verrucomicrobiota bacterium]
MSPKQLTTAFIENVRPALDSGRYPIKRIVGEPLVVEADLLKDGHDVTVAFLKWRCEGEKAWRETAMEHLGNDHWRGVCSFDTIGLGEFTIEVYTERWLTWQHEYLKKFDAGVPNLALEIEEGARLIDAAAQRAKKTADAPRLKEFAAALRAGSTAEVRALAVDPQLQVLMTAYADRDLTCEMEPHRVRVDREAARFGAWYEFFPRSAEGHADRGSTFRDCLPRIDAAKAMGFDTIYFPPIHPIGFKNRKGRNNSTTCEPGDPGVPYAIGAPSGGHYAIEPALGTMKDFEWLLKEIRKRDMELVLDFAINCSPDHPYVKEHPDWFHVRPDGSIKFAENPPKKYEDIYPLNWTCPDWKALWSEMRDVLLFWAGKGVRIFRVDNPHTKPIAMWEFIIEAVQKQFPDVIFLSEAFTRPRLMQALAKVGFTQSYTYFTWRTQKAELIQYFEELTQSPVKEYMRGNIFPNTPDILPWHLQRAPRNTFLHRFALTATLSPIYGMYSGFELCENEPFPGKEEYWDSEKYHYKGRDWNAPGNIIDWVTCLNGIRRSERALQLYDNLRFHRADNDQILFYSKVTPSRDSRLLIAVNLDSHHYQSCQVEVPLEHLGLEENASYRVRDLITGESYEWRGRWNYIGLRPDCPAHVLSLA